MAEVPPTPLLPTKMGGWDLEIESLLIDQGPIFGDESMMEMTFEMSRIEDTQEDGHYWKTTDEGDESTETIVMSKMEREEVTVLEDQEDSEVEAAREAGGHLNRPEPTLFAIEEDKDAAYHKIDQNDYYGDYPPSPFLDSSLRKSRRTAEPAQSITLPEADVQSPLPPNIDFSLNQTDLQSPGFPSLSLEAIVPEDIAFTARGDKPTLAEEEWSSSLKSVRSREVSLMVDGRGHEGHLEGRETGNRNTTAKRLANSPRQSQEEKKPKHRSTSQDDYYSRRLSRSASTTSTSFTSPVLNHVDLPSSVPLGRSSSISQNAAAGPSRRILAPESHRAGAASPPIRGSIPALSNPIGDEEEDLPPPRPSFLSRLIARSSILHPASTVPYGNSPYEMPSDRRSIRDTSCLAGASASQPKTSEIPLIDDQRGDIEDIETARSRRVSGVSSAHPVWDIGHLDSEDHSAHLFGDSLLRRSTTHGFMYRDGGSMDLSMGNMSVASEVSITSRHLTSNLPMDSQLDQSTYSHRSRHMNHSTTDLGHNSPGSSSISHSLKNPGRLQISHREEAIHKETALSSKGSQSPHTSTFMKTDDRSSLRRSASQRVIGFFSDLLRSSTSSRSGSDQIQTPTCSLSASSSREEEMDGDELCVEDMEEQTDFEEHGYEQDGRSSRRDLGESRAQYSADGNHGTYMPPPPRYIPLTRPNKAPVSHTASRAANPVRRPRPIPSTAKSAGTSSFASAALARLPPPGKGCSSAGERTVVKPLERATNLQARRALFEKSKNQPVFPAVEGKETLQRLNPDKGISYGLEEKRRMREVEERKKRLEEERAYREKRKETVVKARPVPDMYRRKLH